MLVQFFTNQEIEAATRELKDARVIPGMMSESAALNVTMSFALRGERKDLSRTAYRLGQALKGHPDAFLFLARDYQFSVESLVPYGAVVVRSQVCASTLENQELARKAFLRYLVAEYRLDEPSLAERCEALEAQVRALTTALATTKR